jgi:hypothetical protein
MRCVKLDNPLTLGVETFCELEKKWYEHPESKYILLLGVEPTLLPAPD